MARTHTFSVHLALVAALLAGGCKDDGSFGDADGGSGGADGGPCKTGEVRCSGNNVMGCRDGTWSVKYACTGGQVCASGLGRCADCDPGKNHCKGDDLYTCDKDGNLGTKVRTCAAGSCKNGTCTDACGVAAASRSYVGCEYWPTVTSNSTVAKDFAFAVVVSNANTTAAEVTVYRSGGSQVASATVKGGTSKAITLPWVDALRGDATLGIRERSVSLAGGAYFLRSTVPVTVYQFSPLEYVLQHDCKLGQDVTPGDNKCHSWTNDASLLLPQHALGTEYMVLSYPSMALRWGQDFITSPGFFTVVPVKDGTTRVTVKFSAETRAGINSVLAYHKGDTATFDLAKWTVLQIVSELPQTCTYVKKDAAGREFCDLSKTTDLTGTLITADKDIAVFGGHNCALVPFDKLACDHLEEQLFPLRTWGKRYLATHTASSGKDPNVYRIVSGQDNNVLAFDPSTVHAGTTLAKGQVLDVTTTADFEVKGTGPLAVAQLMVGQSYQNPNPGTGAPGDPAMSLAVPVEQFRKDYIFLAPTTFEKSYVNILLPKGASVKLDGKTVDAGVFSAIGNSGYSVARVKVDGGSHSVQSTSKVGIAVYGVGAYTSYMYPGGLDLKLLY